MSASFVKGAFQITCRPSSVCLSVCPSVCKLFLFWTFSKKSLGQFQPNLIQSILGWRRLKFVQMKGLALFQGKIIMKEWKYIDQIKKNFFSRTTESISTKLGTKHPWVMRDQISSNEGPHIFLREINYEIAKIHWQNLKIFSRTAGPISTKLAQNILG